MSTPMPSFVQKAVHHHAPHLKLGVNFLSSSRCSSIPQVCRKIYRYMEGWHVFNAQNPTLSTLYNQAELQCRVDIHQIGTAALGVYK
jgi:hypothetical protein